MARRFPQQFLHLLGSNTGVADFADIAAVHTRSEGLGTESHKGHSNQPQKHLGQAAVFFDDGKHKKGNVVKIKCGIVTVLRVAGYSKLT